MKTQNFLVLGEKTWIIINFVFIRVVSRRDQRIFSFLSQENCIDTVKQRVKVKVKQSRYRPGVAQRVPGS